MLNTGLRKLNGSCVGVVGLHLLVNVMQRIPRPPTWKYTDEKRVEGVEKVRLSSESQKALGCTVMKEVFLEYPWAYVPRENVALLLKTEGSDLQPLKESLAKYEGESVLVGYASSELASTEFVVCTTEEARDAIARRNREIKAMLDVYVARMFSKVSSDSWKTLGSELEVEDEVPRGTRPLFEVEISVPIEILGKSRELIDRGPEDCRDGCIEIVPIHEKFEVVPLTRLTKSIQTNLPGREFGVQTKFGFPKNVWAQCDWENPQVESSAEEVIGESADEDAEAKESHEEEVPPAQETVNEAEAIPTVAGSREQEERIEEGPKSCKQLNPVDIFMEEHADGVIDVIDYNAAINLHAREIDELVLQGRQTSRSHREGTYTEVECFIDLSFTNGKVVSAVSSHPTLSGVAAVCYVDEPNCDLLRGPALVVDRKPSSDEQPDSVVLLWSFFDPITPKFLLTHHLTVTTVSFCPFRPDILIGGCRSGQILLWDLAGKLSKFESSGDKRAETQFLNVANRDAVSVIASSAVSNNFQSHHSSVSRIEWLPAYHRVESDGRLTIVPENNSLQFFTASEDGCVAVWDLNAEFAAPSSGAREKTRRKSSAVPGTDFSGNSSEFRKIDGLLSPIYRILVKIPKESRQLALLSLFVQDPQSTSEKGVKDCARHFWVGSADGDFLYCAWEGHEFAEVASSENCKNLGWSRVHDGPVIGIAESPHLSEVLLTVGGRILAVWQRDSLYSPLLRRRSEQRYTACCWTSSPGVFVVARSDGDIETWDLCSKTTECIATRSISGKRITGLYPVVLAPVGDAIAVCDHNGALRVFLEAKSSDSVVSDRVERFARYVERETIRKLNFRTWQSNYGVTNPQCLQRKADRAAEEAKRKHDEARVKFEREQEELARLQAEAEEKARLMRRSKQEKWRDADFERMRTTLLAKKGFMPRELKAMRQPLLQQDEERVVKLKKAAERANEPEVHFDEVLGIICMACASPAYISATHWFLFVAVSAFIASLIWTFVYLFSLREALKIPVNWILTELLNTGIFTVLYMIAFICQLAVWSGYVGWPRGSNIAAGAFGIFNTIAYAAGAYFLYIEWKSSNTQ